MPQAPSPGLGSMCSPREVMIQRHSSAWNAYKLAHAHRRERQPPRLEAPVEVPQLVPLPLPRKRSGRRDPAPQCRTGRAPCGGDRRAERGNARGGLARPPEQRRTRHGADCIRGRADLIQAIPRRLGAPGPQMVPAHRRRRRSGAGEAPRDHIHRHDRRGGHFEVCHPHARRHRPQVAWPPRSPDIAARGASGRGLRCPSPPVGYPDADAVELSGGNVGAAERLGVTVPAGLGSGPTRSS